MMNRTFSIRIQKKKNLKILMLSSLSKALFLKHYKFPPKTTEEAKIVFAHTHGFSIRSITNAFNFGSNKICRVIQEYKKN